jgi:histone H3/H4
MPRNGQSPGWAELDEGDPNWSPEPFSGSAGRKTKKQKIEKVCDKPAPGVEEGIEVKTKFPVARIKRIMQADEDVGKVSQVTPTAVSKALELFMISLVTKAANEAKSKSSKRVTAAHLKQACERDDQWDFLASIMEKVPDAAHAKKEDDSEETGDGRRKKGGPRRRKRDSDEH